MISGASHLAEERLFDCYMAARAGEPADPPTAEHLADCPACGARYADLAQFMDDLRAAGDADIDALFPAERLREQHQLIARRIEFVGRSARVITFPQAASPRQLPARRRRAVPSWVAATAAAGLFAGVAVGMFFERVGRPAPVAAPVAAVASAPRVVAPVVEPSVVDSEMERQELFMSEINLAADSPRTAELAAYDELTPHIREVSFTLSGR